jgi:uncharacterized protein
MSREQSAKLLRIHISEGDRYMGKPLYEVLVEKCRELKISGATVFRGVEGYGETAAMHKSQLTRHDRPIVLAIVDSAENIARLMEAAEGMMGTGVMAISEVRARRVQNAARMEDGAG